MSKTRLYSSVDVSILHKDWHGQYSLSSIFLNPKLMAVSLMHTIASFQKLIFSLRSMSLLFMVSVLRRVSSGTDHFSHGFANPRGYPGMGTGQLKVTHQKPTPMARVWRVFPGTQITKRHMCHISLSYHTTDTTRHPGHEPKHNNMEVGRWGGGEKDEGGDGLSCPSP